jgi:hypothetical protein
MAVAATESRVLPVTTEPEGKYDADQQPKPVYTTVEPSAFPAKRLRIVMIGAGYYFRARWRQSLILTTN